MYLYITIVVFVVALIAFIWFLAKGHIEYDYKVVDINNLTPEEYISCLIVAPILLFLISYLWPVLILSGMMYLIAKGVSKNNDRKEEIENV